MCITAFRQQQVRLWGFKKKREDVPARTGSPGEPGSPSVLSPVCASEISIGPATLNPLKTIMNEMIMKAFLRPQAERTTLRVSTTNCPPPTVSHTSLSRPTFHGYNLCAALTLQHPGILSTVVTILCEREGKYFVQSVQQVSGGDDRLQNLP